MKGSRVACVILGWLRCFPRESEFLHFGDERGSWQAKSGRSAAGSSHYAVGFAKGGQNMRALRVGESPHDT